MVLKIQTVKFSNKFGKVEFQQKFGQNEESWTKSDPESLFFHIEHFANFPLAIRLAFNFLEAKIIK